MNFLVSVIVITYNSASFVLETLESIKEQTYKNIELIVSDDFSTDNTIQIVKQWIEQNKRKFINVVIIESEKNTGISANCNRGLHKAQGEYVKFIAGDDLLYETCIEENVKYSTTHNCDFVFSQYWAFNDGDIGTELEQHRQSQQRVEKYFQLDASSQFRMLTRCCLINAPSAFIKTSILKDLGGYDERFKIEDYPLWLKATQRGHKFHYLRKYTVKYRIHHASISYVESFVPGKLWMINESYKIYTMLRRPYLEFLERLDEDIRFFISFKVAQGKNNRKQYLRYRYLLLLSPLAVWRQFKKRILFLN